MGVSVYTVADDRFFPGLLGLIASLRVHGYGGRVVVVDTGLTRGQTKALSHEATLLPAPSDIPPLYTKPLGPLESPDDVMLFVDADMLCVRPLDELIDRARGGAILAIEDIGRPSLSEAIWHQWEERLNLGPLQPGAYVNSGFFAARRTEGLAFFALFAECLDRVDASETLLGSSVPNFDLPFYLVDQDIANALLWSRRFCTSASVLPYRSAPHAPFRGVRASPDLSCVDGTGHRPFFLHHALQKPWLEPLPSSPYSELLVEFLSHPLSPFVDYGELPLFLRPGPVAHAVRWVRSVRGQVRSHTRGKLGLRPYLEARARQLMPL